MFACVQLLTVGALKYEASKMEASGVGGAPPTFMTEIEVLDAPIFVGGLSGKRLMRGACHCCA